MRAGNVTDDVESRSYGTVEGGAFPKNWYVALVRIKCEKRSARKLKDLGFKTFVPVQNEIHQWSDRRKKIEKIIIPLAVFVFADQQSIRIVEKQPYVYRLLHAPGDRFPAKIPDDQIKKFMFMLGSSDSAVQMGPLDIKKGDTVRIARGKLKGLEGFVSEIDDYKSKLSIVIDCIGCASIIIDKKDIEVI